MKKYISIITVFLTIGIAGCKKTFLNQELNPNSPSVTTPQLTLAGALGTAVAIVNEGDYSQFGVWVQYWTNSGNYVPNSSLDEFQITNTSFTGSWTDLYENITNFNDLETTVATGAANANYQAIAMIMEAYDFQQLVDQYGNVPYSQALQPQTILFPAFDDAQTIYNDLDKQLDNAISLINKSSGAANPGSADIVFGGNMTGWKKFANSIKLRLAIRQSTKNQGNATAGDLSSTASEGYLDDKLDAEAQPGYSNTAGKQSPFYLNYGVDANGNATFPNVYYRGNQFFINALNGFNDPRITSIYYGTSADPTKIVGNTFGDPQGSPTVKSNPGTSAIGPGLLIGPGQNAVLMSGAESLFLQAEAQLDGYDISAGASYGTAQLSYQAAITASFVAMHAGTTVSYDPNGNPTAVNYPTAAQSAALAQTYYAQNIVNVGWTASAANQKEAIIYQKWIALCGFGCLEAYLEYERTGFPVLPNPVSIDPNAVSKTLPVRNYYPQEELNTNGTQLAKEGTINIFTTKIFWEQ